MFETKQSTALDVLFFAHDVNGDAVTGKVDGDWTKRISKNGAAFAAMTVTITERENGWYAFTLSAAHSDTLGLLAATFTATGVKQVNLLVRVTARITDDLATAAALTTVQADTDDIQARLPAVLVGGRMDSSVGAVAAAAIGAAAFAADALSAAAFAQAAADKIWSSLTRTLTTLAGTPAADVRTEMDANSVDLNSILGFVDDLELRLTAARAANLDNLNATITSRAAAGDAMTLTAGERDAIAAALLDLAAAIETGLTVRQALRVVAAACAGKASGLDTVTARYRNAQADSKDRITVTVDPNGNRSVVTLDVS